MSLKRRASYMLLPAVIGWFGNVPLEHVSARKVAICIQCPPVGACGPVRPIGLPFPPHARRAPSLVKPRRRFKWNEMANCGDTYVFFDPLGSRVSMLSSNSQSFALYNGCQEAVSKGGLDRFVRPSQPSIRLTFNTLEAHNKNQQLSRGSKPLNACQYLTGKTPIKSFCQKESRIQFLLRIGPSLAWTFKTVQEDISFFRALKNNRSHISPDNTYKTKENHIKEMFLLIKARHNVADYHRIIKFVIGGWRLC